MAGKGQYPGVYVQELPAEANTISGSVTNVTAFVATARAGPLGTPVQVFSQTEFERTFGASATRPLALSVGAFFQNGGIAATVVRAPSSDPAGLSAALQALARSGGFNLLCVPEIRAVAQPAYTAVARTAAELCVAERAMLLLDPPQTLASANEAAAWASNMATALGAPLSPNVAAYWPEILLPAQAAGRSNRIGASGAVGGVIARTDETGGVWKAPAGTDASLLGVSGVASPVSNRQNQHLSAVGLNAIRTFPAYGTIVWGARTLHGIGGGDDWKYVPVRRLALYLEDSLVRGMRWAVYEPNAEPLWASLRASVGSFLNSLLRQGALAGRTAKDAYFVKCDETTGSSGDAVIVVGFAPLKPAEFIMLTIRQPTAG